MHELSARTGVSWAAPSAAFVRGTARSNSPRLRRAATAVIVVAWLAPALAVPRSAAGAPEVVVELGAGGRLEGRLEAIEDSIRLLVRDDVVAVPVADVRRLSVVGDPPEQGARAVLLQLVDGSRIAGDAFRFAAGGATLDVGEARIELPVEQVLWAAFAPEGDPVAWRDALPDRLESDVVVIERAGEKEAVACGIVAVDADLVTILLDGEPLRVKRSRVIGLQWLRPRAAAGGIQVTVAGGSLAANRVQWTPSGLVLDDRVRLPAGMLRDIDYAAGRTARLATLPLERVTSEPFFGRLAAVEGLSAFFAPRFVPRAGPSVGPAEAGVPADLLVRPRSELVWRLPEHSRRLRTVVVPAGGPQAAGRVELIVLVDDREVLRHAVDVAGMRADRDATGSPASATTAPLEAGLPIDVPVTEGRRLTIRVDFVAGGGAGGPLRFTDPRLER